MGSSYCGTETFAIRSLPAASDPKIQHAAASSSLAAGPGEQFMAVKVRCRPSDTGYGPLPPFEHGAGPFAWSGAPRWRSLAVTFSCRAPLASHHGGRASCLCAYRPRVADLQTDALLMFVNGGR